MTMTTLQHSPQQAALIEWVDHGEGSAFLVSRAGTGKTSTIVGVADEETSEVLLEGAAAYMRGEVAICAYNKKIATEIEQRLIKMGLSNRVKAGTFHKFGFAAVRRVYPRAKLDERAKRDAILATVRPRLPYQLRGEDYHVSSVESFGFKLCSLAKNAALGLHGSVDDDSQWWALVEHHDLGYDVENPEHLAAGVSAAKMMLRASNELVPRLIDFDDMIYVPATRGIKVLENDWLVVDEAQDT